MMLTRAEVEALANSEFWVPEIRALARDWLAMEAVVARLPKTADGVVVTPGSTVWVEWPRVGGPTPVFIPNIEATTMHADSYGYISAPWDKCYSSEEAWLAAAAAREGGK